MERAVPDVPFAQALRFWVKLGFINFGGPTGQIAIMHDELVERRRWIDEPRFLHALNFAMLLPGPEAHQLAIYVGWLLNGSAGALAAGVFFLLPALGLMLLLSWVYVVHGGIAWIAAVFVGLSWGVVGIVAAALFRIGGRAVRGAGDVATAVVAFVALFLFGVPFPFVIAVAGLVGSVRGSTAGTEPVVVDVGRPGIAPSWRRTLRVLSIGIAVWLLPLVAVVAIVGSDAVIADEAKFFALMSLVTFGGAYAVLAYVNQAAVFRFGWLSSGEMAVGLSLAETTPGPLILTVVFVGAVAAYRHPGALEPAVAGVVGGLVTAWATFVPSFLWIFLGAPSIERLRGNRRLSSALAAITAAVVGVIANLAVVFAIGVLFDERTTVRVAWHDVVLPRLGSLDLLAALVAAAGYVAIARFRVSVIWVVAASGLIGLARWALT
jgi:chromate transporter